MTTGSSPNHAYLPTLSSTNVIAQTVFLAAITHRTARRRVVSSRLPRESGPGTRHAGGQAKCQGESCAVSRQTMSPGARLSHGKAQDEP
jgi:hypothetical protein